MLIKASLSLVLESLDLQVGGMKSNCCKEAQSVSSFCGLGAYCRGHYYQVSNL